MLNKVIFVPRFTAEATGPWPDWAIISLTDPGSAFGPVQIKRGWRGILRLEFHDTEADREYEADYQHMQLKDAEKIVEFVRQLAPEIDGIVVHCTAGVARSAAVAKWIAGEYRIPFDAAYDKYNRHVYKLLIEAGQSDRT